MKDRSTYWIVVLALLLLGILRLAVSSIPLFNVDEAVSAVVAQEIVEGGMPYQDAIDHRGPLTYYFYALIFELFGAWNMAAVHQAYVLVLGMILLVVWRSNSALGALAALFFAVFSWTHAPMDMWAAHTEWLLILGTSFGMYLLMQNSDRLLVYGLAGICLGIAALSKQVAVWEMAAVGGWILWKNGISLESWKRLFLEGLGTLVGFALPLIGMLLYFVSNDAWADFQFYVWDYNIKYYLPEVGLLDRISSSLALLVSFFESAWLLAVLAVIGLLDAWKRIRNLSVNERLLLCWFIGAMLGGLTSGRNFGHYAIQWLPPSCLLAAWGWRYIFGVFPRQIQASVPAPTILISLLTLGLLLPIGGTLVRNKVYLESAFAQDPHPAPYIREHTESDQRIFIWGFAPAFYVHAQRRPSSRFAYCNVLTGLIPWENVGKESTTYAQVPGTWEQLMEDLKNHPPELILDTSPADYHSYGKYPLSDFPLLSNWIAEHYMRDSLFLQQYPQSPYHLYLRKP